MASLKEHFLIGAFADYYQELALAKRAIVAGNLSDYLGVRLSEKPADDAILVAMLYKRLRAKLTQQQRFIRSNATAMEQRDYLKVLYAACALTDEQFLFDVDWKQQSRWQEHYLMEQAFFSSADAGYRVFNYIEQILLDRSKINNRSDLAAVYLLTLTLGFRGKHRDWNIYNQEITSETGRQPLRGKLAINGQYALRGEFLNVPQKIEIGSIEIEKQKLYRIIEKPIEQDRVFAQAYNYLLFVTEDTSVHRIAPLRRWYKYGAYVAALYLVMSSILWVSMTNGIEESIVSLQKSSSTPCINQVAPYQYISGVGSTDSENNPINSTQSQSIGNDNPC